jgi:predicted GIY-YIG superfamily endonuclease
MDGQGCPNCNRQLNKFKRSVWNKLNEGKSVTLYVIRCWNDNESFIKIGITKNFTNRYNSYNKIAI